ncbi:MAG: AbrB family transcriptional regulator [Desulfovibrio sp.]|nr:AbrB family transcriptional regulator [Desulfovibrio sp.]
MKNNKNQKENNNKWYKAKDKDIIVYYLIAIFFVEIIATTIAFFYGVVHAEYISPNGPRLAKFPWFGWIIATCLIPVILLLLFHLSGWFFTKSLDISEKASATGGESLRVPDKVKVLYALINNAPTVLVLLTLLAFGVLIFFIDSALATITPYLPWIIGGISVFLTVSYIARLFFISHENKINKEYEYRMHVLRETGIILTDKKTMRLNQAQEEKNFLNEAQILELPTSAEENPESPEEADERNQTQDIEQNDAPKRMEETDTDSVGFSDTNQPVQQEEIVDAIIAENRNSENGNTSSRP